MNDRSQIVSSLINSQAKNKTTTVQFKDVWSEYENRQGKPKIFKMPKIAFVTCLFFLIVTPVGASVFLNWHNIEFEFGKENQPINPTAEDVAWMDYDMYPMYIDTFETVDFTQAKKISDFEIMRPKDFGMPLILSKGEVNEKGNKINAYWDLFHQGDKWIYARQSLHEESKRILNENEMKLKFNLPQETIVVPIINNDAIALLTDEGKDGHRIQMLVKNKNEQVISFEIRGNIGEAGVIKLARSYTTE